MQPIHERMDYYNNHIAQIHDVITQGNAKATIIARQTMAEVREAVKI
jgi:tryptophanyl-tRNA synthetase